VSGLYSRPGRSGGGKEVWRRGWVELPAFDGLRRLYAGAWPGMVMDGRFLGRASCGPDGGGEVALPGGLLAMLDAACDVVTDASGRWCARVTGRKWTVLRCCMHRVRWGRRCDRLPSHPP